MNMSDLERLLTTIQPDQHTPESGGGDRVDVTRAVREYLLDCQVGLSEATCKWYRSLLSRYVAANEDRDITSISATDIREYVVSLKTADVRYADAPQRHPEQGSLSRTTIAGHVTALHAFWRWAAHEYKIDNPCANVKRVRPPKPTPKAIAAADFVRLFNICSEDEIGDRNRAMLAFLADTGVRVGGLVSLQLDKLLLPDLQAVITEKGDKARIVVYTRYTRALLALWLDRRAVSSDYVWTNPKTGDAITTSGIEQVLRRLKKAAGVTGRVNPHSFRHAFAREYLAAGGDAIRLARLIGHSDVNTTAAYYAIFSPDELATMHEAYSPLKRMMGEG